MYAALGDEGVGNHLSLQMLMVIYDVLGRRLWCTQQAGVTPAELIPCQPPTHTAIDTDTTVHLTPLRLKC